jgi:3',5'-nucleoside bisphosphate phosphatase
MPARQPFTTLCQALARPRFAGRADLHAHTTFSDGAYTPAQLVDLARRSGLSALAITDHDTLAGIGPAQHAAAGRIEIVAGVEITTQWCGGELHLLAYFVNENDPALNAALQRLQRRRVERFRAMVDRLSGLGVRLDDVDVDSLSRDTTLGRRHLAQLLVDSRKAGSISEAFQRWLRDHGPVCAPKERLPVEEAIALVCGAGGVTSWAHPPQDATKMEFTELRRHGLHAVEVEHPRCRASRSRELRAWAAELGLAVSAGSDCHGPDEPGRAVGACSITAAELDALRECCTIERARGLGPVA